jgi:UDP-GlcNAc3NAcA epimerase
MRIVTIIGARPQIIKAAAISRAILNNFKERLTEIIVHTGQHYDENMSEVFFNELGIPVPDYNLNVGSGMHGKQTATMLAGIEEVLIKEKPSCLLVYGDTNSTLAGAIAASKLHIPIVHIEAGLRSYNKQMPEEINRILCDHISTLLFSPTKTGLKNLIAEGFETQNTGPCNADHPKVFHCGDIMYDNSMHFSLLADPKSTFLKMHSLQKGAYLLATIHRDNNTDDPERLNALFSCFDRLSRNENIPIVLPLHPRTAKLLEKNLDPFIYALVIANPFIKILPPASFLEMIALEMNAKIILTDSGGVQKEAYFFRKPCIILRPETEWVELIENGTAIIADANPVIIEEAYHYFKTAENLSYPMLFGNGHAAEFICEEILKNIQVIKP